jgi:hypothetical protein
MSEVVVYGSLAASVASLIGMLYMAGYKMGAMQTKVDCLWQIYVKDALSEARRPHGNPKLIDVNKLFPPNLKLTIEKIFCERNKPTSDPDLAIQIEKTLGKELGQIAEENKLPYRVILGTALLIAKEFKNKTLK